MNSLLIALNMIKRALREPGVVLMMLFTPVLGCLIAGIAFGSPATVKLGVSPEGACQPALIQALNGTGRYSVTSMSEDELYKKIEDKYIQLGVILPDDPDESLSGGNPDGKIRIVSNKNDDQVSALKEIIHGYIDYVQTGDRQQLDSAAPEKTGGYEKSYMALGMFTMFMIMLVGAGMNLILSDKKSKTFMRLFCAPLKEYEAVLGKLLANFALGIIQIAVFLLVSVYVMDINWGVPVAHVLVLLVFFLLTAIGFGISITGIIRSTELYVAVNTILAVITCMLGGSFFSTSMFGGVLKLISNFMPQKWMMDAFERLASGAALSDVWTNMLILLLFGAVFFTFGVKTLKPTAEDL